ncbi:MAG: calcium-binding protein [Chloroflexales bacterium]|nr:calcium-binding protein [Chloroflexales bacterium]
MKYRTLFTVPLVLFALIIAPLAMPVGANPVPARLLTDPVLQLPTADSVRVVWYTEFEGADHTLVYGADLEKTVPASTSKMTRMLEDQSSELFGERPSEVVERDIWRHEAIASDLTPNVRMPYFVRSIDDAGRQIVSEQFTLQPLPTPGHGMRILLTSDQQNRPMSPANFQKVIETVGPVDAVFMAGDFVDTPHRASEWFDRNNPGRPAFFPAFQGNFQELFPEHPYVGGAILQNAPLFGTIGNHEAPGRWRPNEQFMLNGRLTTATINHMDNDPQPRWYAELRYEQEKESINPTNDPALREQWISDNSYEFTQYLEMWNHPADGPQGESYYAYRIGDVFVISMNVSRVWRTWNTGENDRGKLTEFRSELNNPDEWGFGDMWFETFGVGSEQYEWLKSMLTSREFQDSKYRVVLAHQTMFGLGDNAVPVMSDQVVTISYEQDGEAQTLRTEWPMNPAAWAAQIEPIVGSITDIQYEYPFENDIWQNDIEPLLLQHGVQLVHTGHSHMWNRARVGTLNYLETSNVGNTFGAYFDNLNRRASWAGLYPDTPKWDPADYPRAGDPHGREPIFPTMSNPMREMEGEARDLPYVASNNVTVFSILDTASGTVSSYAFDTRDPASDVVKFDEFSLNAPYITLNGNAGVCRNTTPLGATLSITLNDVDSTPEGLRLSARSSNQSVVRNSDIVLIGSDAERAVQITVQPAQTGPRSSIVALTVSDGEHTTETQFQVTVGTSGADSITGAANMPNLIMGLRGAGALTGGPLGDLICAGRDAAVIDGGAGNDTLVGGPAADSITGGAGFDAIFAGAGDDNVDGDAGNDLLLGGTGNDALDGGVGNDLINGGPGDDTMRGGESNDTMRGAQGADFFDGGLGIDSAVDYDPSQGDTYAQGSIENLP